MTDEKQPNPFGGDDEPMPLWKKIAAFSYVLAIVAEIVVFRSHLSADFIPFDTSHIAPNIVASIIIVEVVTPFGVLLWPPTRRRIHAFADKKLEPIHEHLQKIHAHNEWQARQTAKIHLHLTGKPAEPHPYLSPLEE